jgi:hypothetical protein
VPKRTPLESIRLCIFVRLLVGFIYIGTSKGCRRAARSADNDVDPEQLIRRSATRARAQQREFPFPLFAKNAGSSPGFPTSTAYDPIHKPFLLSLIDSHG